MGRREEGGGETSLCVSLHAGLTHLVMKIVLVY